MTPPDPQSKYLFPEELGENYRKPLIRCVCVCIQVHTYTDTFLCTNIELSSGGGGGVVHIHNIEPLSFFLSFF